MGVYCTHRVLCYLSAFGLPELDLLKSSGQSLFSKTFWVSVHTNELQTLFQFRLSVANVRSYTCFVLVWFLTKGKLPVQSMVPSLSLNNLIPLTTFYSVVVLRFDKIIPLRIDKNRTASDWQNLDPSVLTKLGPLRIDKKRTLRIGKIATPPDWDPSALVKI